MITGIAMVITILQHTEWYRAASYVTPAAYYVVCTYMYGSVCVSMHVFVCVCILYMRTLCSVVTMVTVVMVTLLL